MFVLIPHSQEQDVSSFKKKMTTGNRKKSVRSKLKVFKYLVKIYWVVSSLRNLESSTVTPVKFPRH